MEPKQSTKAQVLQTLKEAKQSSKRLVFTNGCFDILHIGHVRYLEMARALGDLLVVGVNSDASVQRLKGPLRPIVPEAERCEMLEALKSVDCTILFDEDTPLALIETIEPDVLVKGGDWSVQQIVGHEFVQARGGEVRSLPFVDGNSTTSIVERVIERYLQEH